MKKNLWMLGMAVAALTSCTQSEVLDIPESRAIEFKTFVENNSRAVNGTVTKDNIANIYVFGYKVAKNGTFINQMDKFFNNVNVYNVSTQGAGGWTYDNLQYWTKNTTYRFAAYANGDEFLTTSTDVDYLAATDALSFKDYVAGENDLIASVPGDRTTGAELKNEANIAFNFNHLLSKVQFVFSENSNVYLRVEGLNITNAVNKGDAMYYFDATSIDEDDRYIYDTTRGNQGVSWTLSTTTTDVGYVYEPILAPSKSLDVSDEMFVIPQDNKQKVATFNLVTYQDANYTNQINSTPVTIPLTTVNVRMDPESDELTTLDLGYWKPGRVYRYHVTFSASQFDEIPIKFTVNSVTQWDTNLSPNDENDDILPDVGLN